MGVFHYELEGTQKLCTSASGLLWGVGSRAAPDPRLAQ